MNNSKSKQQSRLLRIRRVRAKVKGTAERPRLSVRRSLKHIYAQIINDATGKTLVHASDSEINGKHKKMEAALEVGKLIAERAKAKKIERVVFDRRDKRYHGRVKAVANGAREGGLVF
jgi:large subunit ribosomal protein L18